MLRVGRPAYNIVTTHLVDLAPGAHHEGVIESNHCHDINTLFAELG